MLNLASNTEHPFVDPCKAIADHYKLIDCYIQSHSIRNLAKTTIEKERRFLKAWFEDQGPGDRPLYAWEAMDHINGRGYVCRYSKCLIAAEITTHTIRSYLGILRKFFSFILEHPVLFETETTGKRIQDKYGVILIQSVSEFDMPRYVYEGERVGIPLEPEKLYDFYSIIRGAYFKSGDNLLRQRSYTMAVIAGETGLRIDEIIHLEVEKDIFFESKRIQTRYAKAARGSGKRVRTTIFPPFARDTMQYYLENIRPKLYPTTDGLVFFSRNGKKLCYSEVYRPLKDMVRVAKRSGLHMGDHFCWHWFRRIFATRFIEKFPGKTDVLIELLGHMSPNTVHRYIRHSKAWMDKQIQSVLEGVQGCL
jgi:site-specific recombinase XerD